MSSRPAQSSPSPDSAGAGWAPEAAGAASGLLIFAGFAQPSRAFPLENLALLGLWAVFALAALLLSLRRSRPETAAVFASPAALAVLFLAAWMFARWPGSALSGWAPGPLPVSVTPGRPLAVAFALLPLPFAIGALTATAAGPEFSPRVFAAARAAIAAAGAGFALHAAHQYFIGYGALLRDLEEKTRDMPPLTAQSMIHALKERRVGGRLGNGNVLAALLALCSFFSFSPMTRKEARGGIADWFGVGAAVLCTAAILLTRSRGGLLTLVAASLMASLLLYRQQAKAVRGNGRRTPGTTALLFLAAFAAWTFTMREARAEGILTRLANVNTIKERLVYWEIAGRLWTGAPMSGQGLGAFEAGYPRLKPPEARESRYAHSWVMQTAAEGGAAGLAGFALLWAGALLPLAGLLRRRAGGGPEPDALIEARWAAGGALLLAFNGLFEYSLQTREFLHAAAWFAGAAAGLSLAGGCRELPAGGWRKAGAAAGICMIPFIALGWRQAVPLQLSHHLDWTAQALRDAGEPAAASETFLRAAEWSPKDETLLLNAAMTLPGDPARSLEILRKAERLNPESPRIIQCQGIVLDRTGRTAEALERYRRAVELYPNDAGYRMDLAESLRRNGDESAARREFGEIARRKLPVWEFQRERHGRLLATMGSDENFR